MVGRAARLRAAAERSGGEVFRLDGANVAILYRTACGSSEFEQAQPVRLRRTRDFYHPEPGRGQSLVPLKI